jgi:hypothetical protein
MSFDHTKAVIDALKPFAKLIPVAGGPVEGFVELLGHGCTVAQVCTLTSSYSHIVSSHMHTKDVQTNKEESKALSLHAALLGADVVREMQKMDVTTLLHRKGSVEELLQYVPNLY